MEPTNRDANGNGGRANAQLVQQTQTGIPLRPQRVNEQSGVPIQWPISYFPGMSQPAGGVPHRKRRTKKKKRDRRLKFPGQPLMNYPFPGFRPPPLPGLNVNAFVPPPQSQLLLQLQRQPYEQVPLKSPGQLHYPHPLSHKLTNQERQLRKFKKRKKKHRKHHESRIRQLERHSMNIPMTQAMHFSGIEPRRPTNLNFYATNSGQQPGQGSTHTNRRKKNLQANYKGVTWSENEQVYIAQVMFQGKPLVVGSFPEEIRAAVRVDEKLIQMGVTDSHQLNFQTQLERDMALIVLLNSHRCKQQISSETAAAALISLGNGAPNQNATENQNEKEHSDTLLALLGNGVPKDKNGNPNSIKAVMKNILQKNSELQKPFPETLSFQENERVRPRRLTKKTIPRKRQKVTSSSRQKHTTMKQKVCPSSRQKHVTEQSLRVEGEGSAIIASINPKSVSTDGSSEGYVGDAEEVVIKNGIQKPNVSNTEHLSKPQSHSNQRLS